MGADDFRKFEFPKASGLIWANFVQIDPDLYPSLVMCHLTTGTLHAKLSCNDQDLLIVNKQMSVYHDAFYNYFISIYIKKGQKNSDLKLTRILLLKYNVDLCLYACFNTGKQALL